MVLSLPLLFALCVDFIVGDKIGIHNADELIEFSDNVNNGTTYKGTTVFLDLISISMEYRLNLLEIMAISLGHSMDRDTQSVTL